MTQFHNEQVTVEVEKKPHCRVTYRVKASSHLTTQAREQGLKIVSKNLSIPGFRKGKAPPDLLEKQFQGQIEQEWRRVLADLAFKAAEGLTQIPVLGASSRVSYHLTTLTKESADLQFDFESEPDIPSIEYGKFTPPDCKKEPITDQKIDATIDRIREFFGTVNHISDRPAKEGDRVRLDIDLLEGEVPSRVFSNTRFEIAEGKMSSWMRTLVIGMSVGDTREGVSQPDDQATAEEKAAFEPKKVRLILTTIEEWILPPVDDALAQKVGAVNLENMRLRLKDLLTKQEDDLYRRTAREMIAEQLVHLYPIDLPQSLIASETTYRLKQKQQNPYFSNKWKRLTTQERNEEEASLRKESENAIRLFYLCRKIIHDEKLTPDASKLATPQHLPPLEAMFAHPTPPETQEQKALAASRRMLETAQDFILDNLLRGSAP